MESPEFEPRLDPETNTYREQTALEIIDTAFAAIGSSEWRKESCSCEHDNNWKCEYCAIMDGLKAGKRITQTLTELIENNRWLLAIREPKK